MQDSQHRTLALAVSIPLGVCAIVLTLLVLLVAQRRRKRWSPARAGSDLMVHLCQDLPSSPARLEYSIGMGLLHEHVAACVPCSVLALNLCSAGRSPPFLTL